MAQTLANTSDVLSLPSGGSQLAGIGETFQPDPQTGTGRYAIPIVCPPGANGLKPDLVLGYATGGGNGPFGMGFRLATMSINRDTRNGIPTYGQFPGVAGVDQFQFSNAQRLVECEAGRYRLKTEQTFWLILKHQDHWTVTTKDGSVYHLGTSNASRIADPADPTGRVFTWLLDRMTDPNGNEVHYSYRADGAQRYLESIKYGPFEIRIDYEEGRPDGFGSRRAGFEIETRLRATAIRVLSHRNQSRELRRYKFNYDAPGPRHLSLLKQVMMEAGTGSSKVSMPPVTLDYNPLGFEPQELITFRTDDGLPPPSLDNPDVSLVDLAGDGLPDIVATDDFGLTYWQNLGEGLWAPPRSITELPVTDPLGASKLQFADLEGNGTADLLIGADFSGYLPNAAGQDWEAPVVYDAMLPFDLSDPNLRLVDVDGDGRIDAIYSGDDSFLIFFNHGKRGWSPDVQVVARRHDLALWPDVFFSDELIHFADMTGDGLMDIVMIESGEIVYWPNLGRGDWGRRVAMASSPIFDADFEIEGLTLVDVDADGAADLAYIDGDALRLWLNRDGRLYSEEILIDWLPTLQNAKVFVTDATARGRPGLLISYSAHDSANREYRFVPLGADHNPFLMSSIDNGLGARTSISYKPVEYFRNEDRAVGRNWRSFLPFPIHVIDRIEVEDQWSGALARTFYRYRDGHYDGEERVFHGFADVEETEVGDEWTPGVLRKYVFDVGADLSKSEAERRQLSVEAADSQRALAGRQQKSSLFELDDRNQPGPERERVDQEWEVVLVARTDSGTVFSPRQKTMATTTFDASEDDRVIIDRFLRHDETGDLLERELVSGRFDSTFHQELYLREQMAYASAQPNSYEWSRKVLSERKTFDESGDTVALTRTYFDGPAFVGLPLGTLEEGNVARIEELVFDSDVYLANYPDVDPLEIGYQAGELDGHRAWFRNRERYERAGDGRVVAIKGPMGEQLTIEHDPHNIHPIYSTNVLGHVTAVEIDESVEAPTAITHPSGHRERRIYDSLGRVTAQIRLDDDGSEIVYRLVRYDPGKSIGSDARPAGVITIVPRTPLLPENLIRLERDNLDNLGDAFIQAVYYSGSGSELQRRVSAEPDVNGGSRVAVSGATMLDRRGFHRAKGDPYFGTSFSYAPASDSDAEVPFTFQRDYAGRVTKAQRAGAGMRVTQYSVWQTIAWDEKDSVSMSKPTRTEKYDSRGRLSEVLEFPDIDQTISTHYIFGIGGVLKRIVDADDRNVLILEHDALGRRIAVHQIDSGLRRFLLNAGGKVVQTIDPNGARLGFTYDRLNRQQEFAALSVPGTPTLQRFWYDADPDEPARPFLLGRLAKVQDESGFVTFDYDRVGQITTKTRTLGDGRSLTTKTDYDILGNVSDFTFPNGLNLMYEYNEANLLTRIPSVIDEIVYDVGGQVLKRSFANGSVESFNYDAVKRLSSVLVTDGAGTRVLDLSYDYGQGLEVARIVERAENGDVSKAFEYDGLSQLVETSGTSATESFRYDAAGNITHNSRLGSEPLAYEEPEYPNRLTRFSGSGGPIDIKYDAAGQIVGRNDLPKLGYDLLGRLKEVSRPDGTEIQWTYGQGPDRVRKVVKTSAGSRETLYFDEIYEETEYEARAHVLTGGAYTATIVADNSGTRSLQVHHMDHLGSTRCVTDETGAVVARQAYAPYGQPADVTSSINSFIGREYDFDVGLYFLKSRFYDPIVGRFITPDPEVLDNPLAFAFNPRLLNPYAYAANNPIGYRDPNGRFAVFAAIIVGAVIGGYLGYKAAKEQGHNPWAGALIGGIIGGLTGGYGGFAAVKVAGNAALFSGGIALATGDRENVWTAAAISFAFAAGGLAVGDWTPVAGDNLWVDVQNFSKEVAIDAGTGALRGAITAAIGGEDILNGFVDGAVKAAVLSSAKIAVLGVRYDAMAGKDPQGPNLQPEVEVKYVFDSYLKDNSSLAPSIRELGSPDLRGVAFRRHGLITRIPGLGGIALGSNISVSEGLHYNTSVLAHEIRHIHQQQLLTLGSVEFYTRYLALLPFQYKQFYQNTSDNTSWEPHVGGY